MTLPKLREVPPRQPLTKPNRTYSENRGANNYLHADARCDVHQHRGEWMCSQCPHDKCLWDAEVPVIRDVVDDYIRGKLNVWL